jgi:hypothetical protein
MKSHHRPRNKLLENRKSSADPNKPLGHALEEEKIRRARRFRRFQSADESN